MGDGTYALGSILEQGVLPVLERIAAALERQNELGQAMLEGGQQHARAMQEQALRTSAAMDEMLSSTARMAMDVLPAPDAPPEA